MSKIKKIAATACVFTSGVLGWEFGELVGGIFANMALDPGDGLKVPLVTASKVGFFAICSALPVAIYQIRDDIQPPPQSDLPTPLPDNVRNIANYRQVIKSEHTPPTDV